MNDRSRIRTSHLDAMDRCLPSPGGSSRQCETAEHRKSAANRTMNSCNTSSLYYLRAIKPAR
jgi:hypothetical protein